MRKIGADLGAPHFRQQNMDYSSMCFVAVNAIKFF